MRLDQQHPPVGLTRAWRLRTLVFFAASNLRGAAYRSRVGAANRVFSASKSDRSDGHGQAPFSGVLVQHTVILRGQKRVLLPGAWFKAFAVFGC